MKLLNEDSLTRSSQRVCSSEILSEILKDEIENDEIGKRRHNSLSNRRAAPRHRNRGYALEEMEHLSDKEFQRMFRLNRRAFYWLLSKIHHDISPAASLRQRVQLERNISATTKLAVMMRWLGGGSYLDICFAFGIAVGTFYKSKGILWGTMEAVNKLSPARTLPLKSGPALPVE